MLILNRKIFFSLSCSLFVFCLFVWLCDDDEDGIEGGEEGEGAREKCTAARDGTDQNSTAQRSKFQCEINFSFSFRFAFLIGGREI